MIGKASVALAYAYTIPPDAKASIVISSGRIESLLKYQEVIYDLYHNGFAVFIMDHRGQGLSARMTADPEQGYVANFDDYVDDFIAFNKTIVAPRQVGDSFLLCHSMGGAIGALTVVREPTLFQKMVLCSPMFAIQPPLPESLANLLLRMSFRWHKWRKQDIGYFFGQGHYHAYPFAVNPLTHSKIRYKIFRELYAAQPELKLGGVTTQWLQEAKKAMARIAQSTAKLEIPTLAFSADADKIIDNRRQRQVIDTMPNAKLCCVPEAKHELLIEIDTIRNKVMRQILDFLTEAVN
jgi:lysophospholipase